MEHSSELMRLSSLIKSMCSELVSMLCTVLSRTAAFCGCRR